MKTNQVTTADLKAFNMAWKELNAYGTEMNDMIFNMETSMLKMDQISNEAFGVPGVGAGTLTYTVVSFGAMMSGFFLIAKTIQKFIFDFIEKSKNFGEIFKKYNETTLQQLGSVNKELFDKSSVKGFGYTRFTEISKALVGLGAFIEANIQKMDKEEVIWSDKFFPDMNVGISDNTLSATKGVKKLSEWKSGNVAEMGWSVDKLGSVANLVKATIATGIKFKYTTSSTIRAIAANSQKEHDKLMKMKTKEEVASAKAEFELIKKNFANFRFALQTFAFYSLHVIGEFFALCNKAQKSIR